MVRSAEFVKSSAREQDCPAPDKPEYAFIGRSNVGKSSLINLLTNRKQLAKVSSRPGKTQLINHFLIDESWYLVDLPGYGWAKVSKTDKAKWKVMIEDYIANRQNLSNVFVLVDSRLEPQKIDLEFIQWLGEAGVPFSIVFTKADKLSATKLDSSLASYRRILRKSWEELPPEFVTSAEKKLGGDKILTYIEEINRTISA